MHDKPAVDELVRCVTNHLLITNIWIGEGELDFPEAYGEELEMLGPLKVGRGYRFSFSYSVTDIEILARPDRLVIVADANRRVLHCGRNKQVGALQSNQLRLVSIDFLPKVMNRGNGNAEGLYSSEIAIRPGRI